jgi:threonine synthase
MQYLSTRGGPAVSIEQAIMSGTAPDGGLYVPAKLPSMQPTDFAGCETLPEIAEQLLIPFFSGSSLAGRLGGNLPAGP